MGILGIGIFLSIAFLVSENKKRVVWRTILTGLLLQFALALLILGIPKLGVGAPLRFVFEAFTQLIDRFMAFTQEGSKFVFGPLAETKDSWGFVFAFQVIPTILFFSSVTAVAYHLGLLQKVVKAFAWLMRRTLGVSGPESLAASAEIFLGQTESPLLIKPYLPTMSRSEIFALMTGGMATVAGGVLAAYVGLLKGRIPDIAGHLLTASVLAAPAALVIAKLMVPESQKDSKTEKSETSIDLPLPNDANIIDAAARGASEGLKLGLNVAAMLICFIALIALGNSVVSSLNGFVFGVENMDLSRILGFVFSPIAFLIGVPWADCGQIGNILAEKVVLNEFVAYIHLADFGAQLSDRGVTLASYALCGFANFASIGIQIGGTGAMAPTRRAEIAQMGLKAVLAGNLASFLTAAVVSLLI